MVEFSITAAELPPIIQGGMGVGVSGWRLARAVSETGQLGVVSGTMLDVVIARTLQLGDEGGHIRRALKQFPYQEMADRMVKRYFHEGGIAPDATYRSTPMMTFPVPPISFGNTMVLSERLICKLALFDSVTGKVLMLPVAVRLPMRSVPVSTLVAPA